MGASREEKRVRASAAQKLWLCDSPGAAGALPHMLGSSGRVAVRGSGGGTVVVVVV